MREDAEMLEQDSLTVELRRRRIGDMAVELMSRGDMITVIAGSKSIRGLLTFARGRLAALTVAGDTVDVNLRSGVALHVDKRATAGGVSPRPGPRTLRARLLEYEVANVGVELWAPAHDVEVAGSIGAVGRDHLVVIDHENTEWVIMLNDIAWVRPLGQTD